MVHFSDDAQKKTIGSKNVQFNALCTAVYNSQVEIAHKLISGLCRNDGTPRSDEGLNRPAAEKLVHCLGQMYKRSVGTSPYDMLRGLHEFFTICEALRNRFNHPKLVEGLQEYTEKTIKTLIHKKCNEDDICTIGVRALRAGLLTDGRLLTEIGTALLKKASTLPEICIANEFVAFLAKSSPKCFLDRDSGKLVKRFVQIAMSPHPLNSTEDGGAYTPPMWKERDPFSPPYGVESCLLHAARRMVSTWATIFEIAANQSSSPQLARDPASLNAIMSEAVASLLKVSVALFVDHLKESTPRNEVALGVMRMNPALINFKWLRGQEIIEVGARAHLSISLRGAALKIAEAAIDLKLVAGADRDYLAFHERFRLEPNVVTTLLKTIVEVPLPLDRDDVTSLALYVQKCLCSSRLRDTITPKTILNVFEKISTAEVCDEQKLGALLDILEVDFPSTSIWGPQATLDLLYLGYQKVYQISDRLDEIPEPQERQLQFILRRMQNLAEAIEGPQFHERKLHFSTSGDVGDDDEVAPSTSQRAA